MARARVYSRQLQVDHSGRRTFFNLIILMVTALLAARAFFGQQPYVQRHNDFQRAELIARAQERRILRPKYAGFDAIRSAFDDTRSVRNALNNFVALLPDVDETAGPDAPPFYINEMKSSRPVKEVSTTIAIDAPNAGKR